MELTVNDHLFAELLEQSGRLGATIALVHTGSLKPYMNKSEAFRAYGRKQVEQWLRDGHIDPIKDGGHSAAWRIDRIAICTLAAACQLERLLMTADSL